MASLVREAVRVEVIEEFKGFTVKASAAFADPSGHFAPLAMAAEVVAYTHEGRPTGGYARARSTRHAL
jgi:hypothetical protein